MFLYIPVSLRLPHHWKEPNSFDDGRWHILTGPAHQPDDVLDSWFLVIIIIIIIIIIMIILWLYNHIIILWLYNHHHHHHHPMIIQSSSSSSSSSSYDYIPVKPTNENIMIIVIVILWFHKSHSRGFRRCHGLNDRCLGVGQLSRWVLWCIRY